jgi:hemolysin activation/secretion protein
MKKTILLPLFAFLVFLVPTAQAQTVPTQEQAGGVQARQSLESTEQTLREDIKKKRVADPVEQPAAAQDAQVPEGEMVLISRIEVTGAKVISLRKIRKITAGYENKSLSMRSMQEVANKITDLYRENGFITSRAILAPQKIENGLLKIQIIEGKMGKVDVKGNKHYSTSLIKSKIDLKPGDAFNYNTLKVNFTDLNQYRDRHVKTVLTPGQEVGTTDLILNVQDNLPVHVGLSFDNYGSRYLDKKRYHGTLTHNNLLGRDDIMTLAYERAEGHNTYNLSSARYIFPLTNKLSIGGYISKSRLQLGREFAASVARGKSSVYSLYVTRSLIANDLTNLAFDLGFDYKDSFNFQNYNLTSQDRLRNARASLRFDHSDQWGRTIINNEVTQGIPGIMGGLDDKETAFVTSREGAGGLFTKNVLDIFRLHRMPLSSTLLLKGQGQVSSHVLTATEQYQLGGIANVRGFAPGEAVGDIGGTLTAELSFPLYGFPKNLKSPLSKGMIYDALRFAVFYDCGKVAFRNPAADERKTRALSDYGIGVRYDLPENFSARIDVAWPMNATTSDNADFHTWFKISKDF